MARKTDYEKGWQDGYMACKKIVTGAVRDMTALKKEHTAKARGNGAVESMSVTPSRPRGRPRTRAAV